jgi:tetratricopeptide (TPR) repeat protein
LAGLIMRGFAGLLLFCCVWGIYAGISTYVLYKHGQELERAIQTETLTDPNAIWKQWTELSKDNPSSLSLRGARNLVRQSLVGAADRVIASYRNGDVVYESGWKTAREELTRALALEPDDSVRGKLRLTEGHLARMSGTRHRAAADLNDAVDKFNEAQRLLPNSPDPALGLARVYIYGLHDVDRAYQALQQAEKRGHSLGNREKGQLADDYRDRANHVFSESSSVADPAKQKEEIERARQDYLRALELYQSIAPEENSTASIQDVEASLHSVNARLNELEHKRVGEAAIGALKKLLHIWR